MCPLDECDEALLSVPGVALCPSSHRCAESVGLPAGLGTCLGAIDNFLDACGEPDGTGPYDQCGTGMVCLDSSCPNVQSFYTAFRATPSSASLCYLPRREAQTCDSNMADREVVDPATGELARVGCAPCEEGTWCLSNAISGLGGPPDERRCVRACTDAGGLPNDGYCGCEVARCEVLGAEQFRPYSGESIGQAFCEPCMGSRMPGCTADVPCCDRDPLATCQETDEPGVREEGSICCRPVGSDCTPGALEQCCFGSTCGADAVCRPCARAGESGLQSPCCPGLAEVGGICTPCGDLSSQVPDAGRSLASAFCVDESFAVRGADFASVDNAFVPEPEVHWSRVFEGSLGGPLQRTASQVTRVEYSLHPDHRAWLLGTESARPGDRLLALPLGDSRVPGPPRLETVPDPDWVSYRIYDQGRCSLLVNWDTLATALAVRLQQAIPAAAMGTIFNTGGVRVSYELGGAASPFVPGVIVPPSNRVVIEVGWRGSWVGCVLGDNEPLSIRVSADLQGTEGFNETPTSRAFRADLETVGCRVSPDGSEYICTLSDARGALRTETFVRRADFYVGREDLATLDSDMVAEVDGVPTAFTANRLVHCRPVGLRQYLCTGVQFVDDPFCDPLVDPDCTSCDPADPCYGSGDPYTPRLLDLRHTVAVPVDVVENSRDVLLDDLQVAVDLDNLCGPTTELVRTGIRVALEREFRSLHLAIADLIAGIVGSSALSDFGLPPSDLAACSCGADGAPDDEPCRTREWLGGRRHGCADVGGGIFLCDRVRIEPRRVQVRPDGLELILAEDELDPQFALVDGAIGPDGVGLCDPLRAQPLVGDDPAEDPVLGVLAAGDSSILMDGISIYCSPDQPLCRGICPQTGTTCIVAGATADLHGVSGLPEVPPAGFACRFGRCCTEDMSVCGIDPPPPLSCSR